MVAKSGTACLAPGELLAQHRGEKQALPLSKAVEQANKWRQQGLKIGFTNGCFDLLHAGHIHILTQAAGVCDKLIVAVNADISVKRLKGEERPVQPQEVRSAILANLPFVDAVILFEEDTPKEVIEAIRPRFFSQGRRLSDTGYCWRRFCHSQRRRGAGNRVAGGAFHQPFFILFIYPDRLAGKCPNLLRA